MSESKRWADIGEALAAALQEGFKDAYNAEKVRRVFAQNIGVPYEVLHSKRNEEMWEMLNAMLGGLDNEQ